VPALDPVGVPGNKWANVKFDFYHFTYYWFGFWFCNLIWYVESRQSVVIIIHHVWTTGGVWILLR
jgi:hypothetical protein